MRFRPRRSPALLGLAVLGLLACLTATPAAAAPTAPRVGARTAVVMDASGAVLWQRSAHRPVLIASTTKILTALVASEAYPADRRFRVPLAAERVDGTRFGYKTGWRIGRRQLLTTLLLVSANDAAETLAAAYPEGGRAGFIRAMQAKADALGCTDSTWRDPSGLEAAGHRGSAADLAILGKALLAQPELAKLVGSRSVGYRWPDGHVTVLGNHNHFVGFGRDPGALGIKTGYTVKAHSTIVAAQRRGGRTLIAVALGSDDMYDDVRSLLAYGFKVRPSPDAEVLGVRPEAEAGRATAATLPPAERFGGQVGADPASPLVERAGRRLLAAPLPVAASTAVALLLLGGLVVAWFRPGRR